MKARDEVADAFFAVARERAEKFLGRPVHTHIGEATEDEDYQLGLPLWPLYVGQSMASRYVEADIHRDLDRSLHRIIAGFVALTRFAERIEQWTATIDALGLNPMAPPAWAVVAPPGFISMLSPDQRQIINEWIAGGTFEDAEAAADETGTGLEASNGVIEWGGDTSEPGFIIQSGCPQIYIPPQSDAALNALIGKHVSAAPIAEPFTSADPHIWIQAWRHEYEFASVLQIAMGGPWRPLAPAPAGVNASFVTAMPVFGRRYDPTIPLREPFQGEQTAPSTTTVH